MPTRHQKAIAGIEVAADGTEHPSADHVRVVGAVIDSPRTAAAVQAAGDAVRNQRAAEEEYRANLRANPPILYGTGKDFVATLQPLRHHCKLDDQGAPVVVPAKHGKSLQAFRRQLVGTHRRGFGFDRIWALTTEQAALFDTGVWALDYDRCIRGAATKESTDGQADTCTEYRNLLALAQYCELWSTPEHLEVKARYMARYGFLHEHEQVHQPFDPKPPSTDSDDQPVANEETADPPVAHDDAVETPEPEGDTLAMIAALDDDVLTHILGSDDDEAVTSEDDVPPATKTAEEILAEMQTEERTKLDARYKRKRTDTTESPPASASASDSASSECTSDVSEEFCDGEDTGLEPVPAPRQKPQLTNEETQKYVEAARDDFATGEAAIAKAHAMLMESQDDWNEEHPDDDEETRRLGVRSELVRCAEWRKLMQEANAGLLVGTDVGARLGDPGDRLVGVRNDWMHVTLNSGKFQVDLSDGGCMLRLAVTNKKKTRDYVQNIGERSPDLAAALKAWHPIAEAMRPPGQEEAYVMFVTADHLQDRIGGKLAGDAAASRRRKDWRKKHGLSSACKPRHILERLRKGTPEERQENDRLRDSNVEDYGTGSTATAANKRRRGSN